MPAVTKNGIEEWFDIDRENSVDIYNHVQKASSHDEVDETLELASEILGAYGVEAIRGDYHVNNYYDDIVALYVNTGDTYNATLLYVTDTGRFLLTTFGDWVEKNERKYRIE